MQPSLRSIVDTIRMDKGAAAAKQFAVKPVPTLESHLVGWDFKGFPCVLLSSLDAQFRPPLQLAGLEVQYSVPCDVRFPDGMTDHRILSVVSCASSDTAMQDYFLHLMETLLRIIGPQPTLSKIVEAIAGLVEILHELTKAPGRSLIGLYGELSVIAVSSDPIAALKAWRVENSDRFDFSVGDARLEVKATSELVRKHSFSFEQCSPPPGTVAVISSLFVQPTGDGESLAQIIQRILLRVERDDQARFKLQTVVARSLGSTLLSSLSACFDDALANSSLLFFDALSIPAVRGTVPNGVSHIRFQVDLSAAQPAEVSVLRMRSSVIGELLPSFESCQTVARQA